jgi:hypothetical protein
MEAQKRNGSIALFFLETRGLIGVGTSRTGCFILEKETLYPLYRRLGGSQDRSERARKISPLPGLDPRIFQPVESLYTDYGVPVHTLGSCYSKNQK